MKEFSNFNRYVESLDRIYKAEYGMVRVIPPAEWKPRSSSYKEALKAVNVNGPIEQNIFGKGGVYECLHIQKKSLTLEEYKAKTEIFDKNTRNMSVEEIEQMFWKNIVFSPPLYGADILNTLMDDKAGAWNLGRLSTLLQYSMDTKVKGVNTPYCYIGSWKTLFCWHKEDLDLSAINFLHEGKPKFWYSIPESQGHLLEKEAKKLFPDHFSKCSEYLRHKTTLINPYLLAKKYPEIKICKTEHRKGEFILVFGGAYHCGFNLGFNIAEAVNYGTIDWLRQLIDTRPCECSKNSVKACHLEIYKNLLKSPYSREPEFEQFQRKLFSEDIDEDSDEESEGDIQAIKAKFTKKIKKGQRVQQLKHKGDQYDIENWVQCDHCKLWRKVAQKLKIPHKFACKQAGKNCFAKEKISRSYITL